MIVTLINGIYQLTSGQHTYIGKARHLDGGQRETIIIGYIMTKASSVIQNAGVVSLSHHLRKNALRNLQAITAQRIGRQCGTFFFAYRRKLRRIANQHQSASLTAVHILYQIVEQTPATEHTARQSVVTNHRSLINYEQSMLMKIRIHRKIIQLVRERLLSVYPAMNGIRRMSRMMREHLGRSTSRSQQHTFLLQAIQSLDYSTDQRCFSGSGISLQEVNRVMFGRKKEIRKRSDSNFLLFCWFIEKISFNLLR